MALLGASPVSPARQGPAAPERLVAEAPIWGSNNGSNGYAFLPVTIHGKKGTLAINLNCTECDVALSTAALGKIGVTLAGSSSTLDALRIGPDVQRNVPLRIIPKPTWSVPGPDSLPPVVGIVGVHFLTTHYDILYDFPHRIVRLYAIPPKPVSPKTAWFPSGFKPTDCGKMVHVPPGAETFTGVEMQLDGHPVTGVLEMGPYQEKMNQAATNAVGTSRLQPIPPGTLPPGYSHNGYTITQQVPDVHMTIGQNTFWTGPVQLFPVLDVESVLPGGASTPVMLMNLSTIRGLALFNATSSNQVCVATL